MDISGHSIIMILVHRFRNNYTTHCLQIRLHRHKSLGVARYAYIFYTCTLESASCVIGIVIYETMY